MFKKQALHEQGVKKSYIQNQDAKRRPFQVLMRLSRNGAHLKTNRKMQAKLRRCYPRGRAWLRMVDLHTVEWLQSK